MKKSILIASAIAGALCVGSAAAVLTARKVAITRASGVGDWNHYAQKAPTASEKGVREYWVECGGGYQFSAPTEYHEITDMATPADTSEFAVDDDRWLSYQYDENHVGFNEYKYGATMVKIVDGSPDDDNWWRVTYNEDGYNCSLYGDGTTLFRIDLPRIDYTKYPTVTIKVDAPNWYENNKMGPEADQLNYHTVYGGNKDKGKIELSLTPTGVHMDFIDMEYGNAVAFSNTFTNQDIVRGLKSAYFYTTDYSDRYLNFSNFVLSTASSKTAVMHYNSDSSNLSVVNGDIKSIGSTDYSVIGNNYATNDSGFLIDGNANPGAMVATLPAVNLDSYLANGVITTKFGVKNNSNHMYWGSGESKIDLGANSDTSESSNNNGYVNWELTVMDDLAYVHNIKENQNIIVPLTAGMRAGTEGIVISGGDISLYRRYLVTDFYWQLTPDYELTAPTTPMDIYSYNGDTSKISVEHGTVAKAGGTDWSIIGNGYATANTGLEVTGNANPGAMVATLPAINFKPFTNIGKVTFKFGVKNNNEPMYFGSGDSKVSLGNNSPTSQDENNNGYINWEMVITANSAYVHNTYTDQNYNVTLTAGMRAGTESIVLSGGNTSIYRIYLFTDFYWSAL